MGGPAAHKFHSRPDELIVYVVPGSQYSTKVVAGLTSRGLEHRLVFAAFRPVDRVLPSGRLMVPELEYKGETVNDGSKILEFLDTVMPADKERFLPSDAAEEIRALDAMAESKLDAVCDYFNYVDEAGYKRSQWRTLAAAVPWWAFWININRKMAPRRATAVKTCQQAFSDLPDMQSATVMASLLSTLHDVQALLKTDEQTYFFGTSAASVADLAVFAKLARLMDRNGDVTIGAALPDLLSDQPSLARLQTWFTNMESVCKLQWKGKRIPK